MFKDCFDGCPLNQRCGEPLRPCDPLKGMCEPRCICPPEKSFVNDDNECVALKDCVSKYIDTCINY